MLFMGLEKRDRHLEKYPYVGKIDICHMTLYEGLSSRDTATLCHSRSLFSLNLFSPNP